MELNKIYEMDCLDGLRQLPDNSIDLIITSPPYNKGGLNGIPKPNDKTKWHMAISYNGDCNVDNMPEEEYQKWQITFLNECYRVLKEDGSMFYNHKNRIHLGHLISPYQWLFHTDFIIRQEIIWDRGSTNIVNTCRFLPTTELIFWLTKSTHPKFNRKKETKFKKEVWNINFLRGSDHPAPFPIEIPDNIIDCVQNNEEKLTVLDPFMGSGTVAVSAKKHKCDYIGFEKFKTYVDMANIRINKEG